MDDILKDIVNEKEEIFDIIVLNKIKFFQKVFSPWLNKPEEVIPQTTKPRMYTSPQALANEVYKYFYERVTTYMPISYISLVLFLGFSSRSSFDNYKTRKNFKKLLKTIKLIIEGNLVEGLYDKSSYGACQFLLKTNYKNKYGDEIVQIVKNKSYTIDAVNPVKNKKINVPNPDTD